MMTNFLIADDHIVVRKGLRQILEEEYSSAKFGEANNSLEVLEHVRQQSWDLVFLDINMPGRNGLEVLKQIKVDSPKTPVLILSMHSEDQYAIRMLKAGASGYLTKDSAGTELIEATRKILSGKKYISSTLAEKLANNLDVDPERPIHEIISDREYQVLCMIASGKTVSEIAMELSLSVPTISTYRARILEKMNMKTNAELTNYAIRSGLV